ncbi:hypothetical protein CU098_010928 [Rhizopus stolonifer]|uniref:NAD(+) kinase n=1 Tax=Rhizopus stolonifer TaxID=4846 RepID=A0A367JVT3_RHIST|nr:hypothetical protein CU098_010928 [Rhizopus stolonifer]
MELRICVPFNSRNTAWASFDGRGRVELKQGDHIKVTASRYPFPTVCKEDQATDWFNSLQNCLHWNKRERQKSFAVVESHRNNNKNLSASSRSNSSQHLSHSPRTSSGHVSRSGGHSPPQLSPPSNGQDEVFGMFYDDDSGSDHYHGTSRRRSSVMLDQSSASSTNESSDDSDEDTDYSPDGFTGWTDEEIVKSRYMANISKELEKVSIKHVSQ